MAREATADFAGQHPQLHLRVTNSDAMLDLFEHGVDVAVRGGSMADSRLVSRLLASNFRVLCASPGYLERHGHPRSVEELRQHRCLMLHRPGHGVLPWIMQTPEGPRPLRVEAAITCDNGDLMRELAVAGHGIALVALSAGGQVVIHRRLSLGEGGRRTGALAVVRP